jgi:Mg-chelatase subunit ChlD
LNFTILNIGIDFSVCPRSLDKNSHNRPKGKSMNKWQVLFIFFVFLIVLLPSRLWAQTADVLTVTTSANPQAVGVGGQVRVQLALSADSISCPTTVSVAPLDVMLVLDRSSSMRGDKWQGAQQAAKEFIDQMNFAQDRVGVTLFSSDAQLQQALTHDAETVKQAIDNGRPSGGTNIAEGIERGGDELAANEREDVPRVLILLSDGGSNKAAALREANAYKDIGIRIITIGLGNDVEADLLRDVASNPEDYYFAPDPSQLSDIYQSIARSIQQSVGVTDIVITQAFDDTNVELVPGSLSPTADIQGNIITWQMSSLPDDNIEIFSYRLNALMPGTFNAATSTEVAFIQCEAEDKTITLDPGPEIIVSPPPPPPLVTPDHIVGQTCEEGCVEEIVRVEIPSMDSPLVVNQLDVVFLMDVSGSMGDELDVVKAEANVIMQNLRNLVADTNFAVATFADYPGFRDTQYGNLYGGSGDYPWRLDQDLTADMLQVNRAINRISLLNGEDGPEAYTRALYEVQSLSWRPGSRRLVILFGDAFPHDRTFLGTDYGIDPGQDAIANTVDDLQLRRVIADLSAAHINVIAVNTIDAENADVTRFFRYAAEETGGQYFRLDSAEQIPEAIETLVEGQIAAINQIEISAESPYSGWLTVNPASHTNVSYDGRILEFRVRICPGQANAERGDYNFDLTVIADDEAVAAIPAAVTYWPICLPPVDLFVADHLEDDGTDCSNLTGVPFWNSPDIIVRNRDDGERISQELEFGKTNYVYALIHNRGYQDVTDADVHIYWGRSELGYPGVVTWHDLGSMKLDVLGEGETWTPGFAWQPPDDGSYSFLVRVELTDDPVIRENDVACENNLAMNNKLDMILSVPSFQQGDLGGQIPLVLKGEGLYDLTFDLSQLPSAAEFSLTLDQKAFAGWAGEVEGGNIENNNITANQVGTLALHDLPLEADVLKRIALQLRSPSNTVLSVPVLLQQDGADVAGVTLVGQSAFPNMPGTSPQSTPIPIIRPDNPPPRYVIPIALITLLLAGLIFWLLSRRETEM